MRSALLAVFAGLLLCLSAQVYMLTLMDELSPQEPWSGVQVEIVRPDGAKVVIAQERSESISDFWVRVQRESLGKVTCWESNGSEITVTTPQLPNEGTDGHCARHDAAVAEGQELFPKTGECEGPGD